MCSSDLKEIVWKQDYNDPYADQLLQEYMGQAATVDEYGYHHACKVSNKPDLS